jgi:tetratricopeptide (TPR) repeat protein
VVQGLTEGLGLPDWFPGLALVLFIVGLPIVLATAFLQEGMRTGGRHDPTLLPDAQVAMSTPVEPAGAEARMRRTFTWRNAIMGGVFAFALYGVVSAGWLLVSGTTASEAVDPVGTSAVSRVAILPFSVHGSDEYEYLGEGMVNLLGTKLDGAGDLRTVDSRALLGALERQSAGQFDPQRAGVVASQFGAGLYVLGDVLEVGGRLHLEAALYDVSQGEGPVATATAEADVEDIFAAVDELAAQLLGGRAGSAQRITHIASVTTNSLPALRAYLAGEREFRSGRFEQARDAFLLAIEEDSAFALAYYRLSIAAEWLVQSEAAGAAAEQALLLSDRLTEHDRRILEAFEEWRVGNAAEAERRYRSILGTHPDEVEVWWQLGELLFHYGPQRGRSITESRQAWERVLFFEPNHVPALVHMARIASVEGKLEELDSLTRQALRYQPGGDYAHYMNALLAYGLGDEEAQQRVLADLAQAGDNARNNAFYNVAIFTDDVDGAFELARLITDPSHSPEVRANGHVLLADIHLARGRWRAAQTELAAADQLDHGDALEQRALMAAVPFFARPDAELNGLREELEAWTPGEPLVPNPNALPHSDMHHQLRAYLLGLLNARLGNEAEALGYAQQLESLAGSPDAAALARDQTQGILAQVAWTKGREAEALATLEQAPMIRSYLLTVNSAFYGLEYDRYMRAELLNNLGRYEEATSWYCSFLEHASYDVAFLGPSHFRRGEVYEKMGRPEEAARHYNRFVELWSDADPEYQPMVDYARERLVALAGEPSGG